MKNPILLLFAFAALGLAQTAESIPFRALLSPANEVPAVTDFNASGAATIWLHVVRDSSGQVTSGSVDFRVSYSFPGAVSLTGLHIHRGAAGINGPVTINTGIGGAAGPIDDATGKGTIARQAQVASDATAALDTIRGMLADPSGFYVNMHTSVYPGGAIRGQLQRAEMTVLMGLMSTLNEVPAITELTASSITSVVILSTFNDSGGLTSAQIIFDANYTFPAQVTFTGFHIHTGGSTVNGSVVINTGIGGGANSVVSDPGGSGNLHYEVELPMTNAAAVSAVSRLPYYPGDYYVNLHTTTYPGGVIRAQLRSTDNMVFPVAMLPSNEVPAVPGLNARADGTVSVRTLCNPDGSVAAGVVIFDANCRFPADTTFTGFHIHDGTAGNNGSVAINTGIRSEASATGAGNLYRIATVTTAAGLATLNSLVKDPEKHYVNLHSSVNPGGAVRAQLAAASVQTPVVGPIISAVSDPALKTVAPGGLMTIFGSSFAKVATDLSGWAGDSLPASLNGVKVTFGGGQDAPVVAVSPTHVVIQVPVNAAPGPQTVLVTNSNGLGSSGTVTVAAAAPALWFDALGGLVLKNSDFSLVRPANPAAAGDILLIYSTGLGQTTQPQQTGKPVPQSPFAETGDVSVTIGGGNAEVIYSIASPGFVGLYQTAVRMPAGVSAGNAGVTLRMGGTSSNTVMIAVR
jgi:uncharacterized protein (TIGR03437 family)